MGSEPYNSENKLINSNNLVNRVETILFSEKSEWVDLIQNTNKVNKNNS